MSTIGECFDKHSTTRRTYYIMFENFAPLGENKQTVVHFSINSSYMVFLKTP